MCFLALGTVDGSLVPYYFILGAFLPLFGRNQAIDRPSTLKRGILDTSSDVSHP